MVRPNVQPQAWMAGVPAAQSAIIFVSGGELGQRVRYPDLESL